MSKYIVCPERFEPFFEKAEDIMFTEFKNREWNPESGITLISGERYTISRAASMAVALKSQLDQVLGSSSATIIYQIGKACGGADARFYFNKLEMMDESDWGLRLASGPVTAALKGDALANVLPESTPKPNDDYLLVYEHLNAFEAEACLANGITSSTPVDYYMAGYSSGWCSEAIGIKLDAKEITCRAMGAPQCRFVMAPSAKLMEKVREISEKYKS